MGAGGLSPLEPPHFNHCSFSVHGHKIHGEKKMRFSTEIAVYLENGRK